MKEIKFQKGNRRKPVPVSVVLDFAEKLNIVLPTSYVTLAAEMGGCLFENDNVLMSWTVAWDGSNGGDGVEALLHFDSDYGGLCVQHKYELIYPDMPGLVPIISGSPPNYFCFDYRSANKNPPVVHFERDNIYSGPDEVDVNEDNFVERSVHVCAASFYEFIDRLEPFVIPEI